MVCHVNSFNIKELALVQQTRVDVFCDKMYSSPFLYAASHLAYNWILHAVKQWLIWCNQTFIGGVDFNYILSSFLKWPQLFWYVALLLLYNSGLLLK